jgi:two-component system, OmpR family, sensor kinase
MPIRLKLTLAFAGVMSLVLVAVGLFVYTRFRSDLDQSINEALRSRAAQLTATIGEPGSSLRADRRSFGEPDDTLAELLGQRGRIVETTRSPHGTPLLTEGELQRARVETVIVGSRKISGFGEPLRLLARPVSQDGGSQVAVVGQALGDRNDSLHRLLVLLLIGGPVALVLASLAGYGLASAALRPVEAMRRRAAEISTVHGDQRLPVPDTEDEIGRLGRTLNEMLDRLEAAFERERVFVADASHELRTPLSILRTELELALRQGHSVAELREAVSSAAEETDRLSRLADDLLVIARSDQEQFPLRLQTLDVRDLVQTVAGRFEGRAAEAQRELTVEAPDGLGVRADRLRLEQALGNMLDNALRYGDGTVRLRAGERNGVVELHVLDRGEGFPPGFLERAFERFSRADDARSRGGTGLGLAIVDVIARAHGGRAAAANGDGGGADVWVEIPRDS